MIQPDSSPKPSHIKVLHVDDEPDQLQFTKMFLEDFDPGLEVTSVSTPRDVPGLLEEGTYDCVLSDYNMPGLDGIELARRIRESSDVPFIIYTGRGSEEVASEAFTAGVDDYVRKEPNPSHYQVLARRIKHTVERHRAEDNLRSREQELKESEGRLRYLVTNNPAVIYTAEVTGDYAATFVSENVKEQLGIRRRIFWKIRASGRIIFTRMTEHESSQIYRVCL